MKKYLLTATIAIATYSANAQCTPDPTITDPGIYPDTIVNLPHAYAGAAYSTVIQINTLTDTLVPQGNVVVDDIELNSVTGLPAGFSYVCNPASCIFPAGQTKCMVLNGTPPYSPPGIYPLVINVTLHGRLFGFIPVSQPSQMLGYKIVILGTPVADFSGTPTTICNQSYVTYTDMSSNEPTSWSWSFPGGTPSSSNLQVPPQVKYTSSGTKNVTLTVTSPAGNNSLTKTAYITVNSLPAATVTPSGTVIKCSGASLLLSANSGTGLTYQWIQNGVDIAGATASTYSTTVGGNFKVRVTKTSTGCSKTSAATTVSVSTVTATVTPQGPTTFCSGGAVTLGANSGTSLTYQWIKWSTDIAGATGQTYVANASATYKVRVTNADGCSKTSSGVSVTVNPLPTATVTASGPLSFCAGGSVMLTAAPGAGYAWQWRKNNVNIGGATSQSYTATTAGNYKVVVTNTLTGCTKNSPVQTVTVPCRESEIVFGEESFFAIHPNPVSSVATVETELNFDGRIKIDLIDVTGKHVLVIADGNYAAGKHLFSIDAGKLENGIYFVTVISGNKTETLKMVVEKF